MTIYQATKNLYYLQTDCENIPLYISYDRYRTVRFKIRSNLRIDIAAPYYIKQTTLIDLIEKRQTWIINSLTHKEKISLLAKEYAFENNKKIRYLGRDFVIEVNQKNKQKHQVVFNQAKIIVYLVNPASSNELKVVLNNFCHNKLKNFTRKYYQKYAPYFFDHFTKQGFSSPLFSIKQLKRTWGIYKRKEQKIMISLNSKLIEFNPKCIEYVILHELCHSIQANHSAKYWQIVAELMPEHKKYSKLFNAFPF